MRPEVLLITGLLASGAGCSGAASSRDMGMCAGNEVSVSLLGQPDPIVRGQTGLVSIRWETQIELTEPVQARLSTGAQWLATIDVPLARSTQADPIAYEGHLENPFGPGLAPGEVSIMAASQARSGCFAAPTAATALRLE